MKIRHTLMFMPIIVMFAGVLFAQTPVTPPTDTPSGPEIIDLTNNSHLNLSVPPDAMRADYLITLPGDKRMSVTVTKDGMHVIVRIKPEGFSMTIAGSAGEFVAGMKSGDALEISGIIDLNRLLSLSVGDMSQKSDEESAQQPPVLTMSLGNAQNLSVVNIGEGEVLTGASQPDAEPEMLAPNETRDLVLGYSLEVTPKTDVQIPITTMPKGKTVYIALPNDSGAMYVAVEEDNLGKGMRLFVAGSEMVEIALNDYTKLRLFPGDAIRLDTVGDLNIDADGRIWIPGDFSAKSITCIQGEAVVLVGSSNTPDQNTTQSYTIIPGQAMDFSNGIASIIQTPPPPQVTYLGELEPGGAQQQPSMPEAVIANLVESLSKEVNLILQERPPHSP